MTTPKTIEARITHLMNERSALNVRLKTLNHELRDAQKALRFAVAASNRHVTPLRQAEERRRKRRASNEEILLLYLPAKPIAERFPPPGDRRARAQLRRKGPPGVCR